MSDYDIKDSGDRRDFGTGAVRDVTLGKGRFDLVPWEVVKHLAVHYQKGAEKYADRNWEQGIPVSSFFDSAMRHQVEFYMGETNENHLIAAIWNLVSMYQTILWIEKGELPIDLYNLPRRVKLS